MMVAVKNLLSPKTPETQLFFLQKQLFNSKKDMK